MVKFSIASAASNSVTKREKKTRATRSEPPHIAACKALRENCQTAGLLIIFSRYFPVWIQPQEIFIGHQEYPGERGQANRAQKEEHSPGFFSIGKV